MTRRPPPCFCWTLVIGIVIGVAAAFGVMAAVEASRCPPFGCMPGGVVS